MPACSFRRRSNPCAIHRGHRTHDILDHTLAKLRAGVPIRTLLTTSALVVTRSSDLPPVTTVGRCIHWSGSTPCITLPASLGGRPLFVGPAARGPVQQAHSSCRHGALHAAGVRADRCRWGRGDETGLPGCGEPWRLQCGRSPLPMAMAARAAGGSPRSAAQRGDSQKSPG